MALLLFKETPEERFERQLSEVKKELGNVRRGIFARHSELEKKYQETYFELETLKASIAKQDYDIWKSKSLNSTQLKNKKEDSLDLFTFI